MVAIENAPRYRVAVAWNPTAYRRPAAGVALAYVQTVAERQAAEAAQPR